MAASTNSSRCVWLWLWLCSTSSFCFFAMAAGSILSPYNFSPAPHSSLYKFKHGHHQHAGVIAGAPSRPQAPSSSRSIAGAYPPFYAHAGAAPPFPTLSPVADAVSEGPSSVDINADPPSAALLTPASSSKPLPAIAATPSASAPLPPPASLNTSNGAPLDPTQLEALRLLGIHVLGEHPCTSPAMHDILLCDKGSADRHVIALHMELCRRDAVMEGEAMEKLATSLRVLSFVDCPMRPVRMPSQLVKSLVSLTCIASLGKTATSSADEPALTGGWLGRFRNLSELTVADVHVNASGLSEIIAKMKHLKQLRFSNTNITGNLPVNTWPSNLTFLDLALNAISGPLPLALTKLSHLTDMDLGHNQLSGYIPNTFHKLKKLQKLSFASNLLEGPFPSSLSNLSSLIYLDLSSNKLNGPIPHSLNHMKSLRFLDLSHNHFSGQLPFNQTFLDTLNTLKVRGNLGICYDHAMLSSPFLKDVPACDTSGLPIVPSTLSPSQPPQEAFAPSEPQLAGEYPSHPQHRGPRIIIAAVVVTLVLIFVFIMVVVLVSKCRGRKY
ncbi:hypothetical protein GOP47_0019306 [Adiantum capillus-veneris]|uniref:Uncharacterized protein n=1 Tax=Adiantum capillus-veneris TaxID=13818 RepID=A0A9D4ZAD7_ADICA|nr:hypothetical protein GOP47_0019306 [Adiantum capillus-veneris]